MKIGDLDYKTKISETALYNNGNSNNSKIIGGRLAFTNANATADVGGASVQVVAVAIGDYTRTYTSARTSARLSVRKARQGEVSYALGVSAATARLGNETDISSSVAYESYRK